MCTTVPRVPNFDQPFSRYCTCYDFPIDSHDKISKCHKIFKFWQIANIYHNFLFPHDSLIYYKVWLRSDENPWKLKELRFEIFAPIRSHVNENEKKKIVKNWKLKILKKIKWSGEMIKRELPTKVGRYPCSGFWETWVYGRRTTDACATTVALLTKSNRAKKCLNFNFQNLFSQIWVACQKRFIGRVKLGHKLAI